MTRDQTCEDFLARPRAARSAQRPFSAPTPRYAHIKLVGQTRALDALPSIDAPRANVAALAATGT